MPSTNTDFCNTDNLTPICVKVVVEMWSNGFNRPTLLTVKEIKDHIKKCTKCKSRIENYISMNNEPNKEVVAGPVK